MLLSQEEPLSSGSDRGGTKKHHHSKRSRSRSKERSRRSSSPKSHSRKRSRSRSKSRERRDHDRHRSSHHRSSKHRHHHRDHRDRHRDKYDGRDRNYRGNDGRRNRERISEDHRQELRNKKLVNLGITSDAVLAAAAQSGSLDGNSDPVAIRAQQMISKQLEAQVAKAKELTGVELPSYYNPSVINPLKYADQIKKRKLLWGSSGGGTGVKQANNPQENSHEPELTTSTKQSHQETMQARKSMFEATAKKPEQKQSFNKWETTNFGNDQANDKFRRLMGIKSSTAPSNSDSKNPSAVTAVGDKTAKFFQEQEAQYERARAFTHTQRGSGFGFSNCVEQPSEPSTASYASHTSVSGQSNLDSSSSHPHRSIGEKLGFVKKSL